MVNFIDLPNAKIDNVNMLHSHLESALTIIVPSNRSASIILKH